MSPLVKKSLKFVWRTYGLVADMTLEFVTDVALESVTDVALEFVTDETCPSPKGLRQVFCPAKLFTP